MGLRLCGAATAGDYTGGDGCAAVSPHQPISHFPAHSFRCCRSDRVSGPAMGGVRRPQRTSRTTPSTPRTRRSRARRSSAMTGSSDSCSAGSSLTKYGTRWMVAALRPGAALPRCDACAAARDALAGSSHTMRSGQIGVFVGRSRGPFHSRTYTPHVGWPRGFPTAPPAWSIARTACQTVRFRDAVRCHCLPWHHSTRFAGQQGRQTA